MEKQTYNMLVELLKEELIPALGCTEPIAIAFAAAKAREVLGTIPKEMVVRCSGNIIKNVKGVTVPNSGGLKGIDISAVLGAVGGKSSDKLKVLSGVTSEDIRVATELLATGFCSCELAEGKEALYIEVTAKNDTDEVVVVVAREHTNIVSIIKNQQILFVEEPKEEIARETTKPAFTVEDVIEFANTVLIDDVQDVIETQIELNTAIAAEGLSNNWGAEIGRTILKYSSKDDVRVRAKALAAAGSDARMNGCALPVVINSGSGNQGLTASLPVIEFAKEWGKSQEELIRGLVVSNLIAILQKKQIGNLSAFCGAVSAGAGAGAGITYLAEGSYNDISNVITNTLANVGGIVCDGAKSSCAAKIASSVEAATLSFLMATGENKVFSPGEGLVQENVDKTIESFGRVAKVGMKETDIEILNIMIEN